MIGKKEYVEKQLHKLFHVWASRACAVAVLAFLLFSYMDYVWVPEKYLTFFYYRLVISAVLLFLAYLIYISKQHYQHRVLANAAVICSAIVIEFMVLEFGGHASPYYVGFIVLCICVVGFFPAEFEFHLISVMLIYSIYFIPILLFDEITDFKTFFGSNYFMLVSFTVLLVLRYLSGKLLIKELELKYEVEKYQNELELLVDDRTAQLTDTISNLESEKEDKAKLEMQLRQSMKMEAIGRLAGGVAHDFNNILTAIIGYAELTLRKMSADHPMRKNLVHIFDSGKRAAALTGQLLAFSRKQVLETRPVSLNIIINDLAQMLKRLISEDITLENRTPLNGCMINADRSQIEQILMNLAINSRDAMPDGGTLYLETQETYLDDAFATKHEGLRPGPYAVMAVTDNGLGMSREVQEKIFEPFYTTKERGKGTGLGMSTVYGIVKQHNGYITVYSEPGMGTTIKIYFPIFADDVSIKKEIPKQQPDPRGNETLLIVDDDHSIRELIIDTLQPLGYHLLEAESGEMALEMSRDINQKIDLLLTDVIMGGMNGSELSDKLKPVWPDMKVVFMSGYTRRYNRQTRYPGTRHKAYQQTPGPELPALQVTRSP